MNLRKNGIALVVWCCAIHSLSNAAAISPYNALVFGDFSAEASDVEGTAAIGGNVSAINYSVGFQLDSEFASEVLVVGGATALTNARVYHGDFVHLGPTDLTNVGVDGTTRNESILDFSSEHVRYQDLSEQLSELASTGSATVQFNTLTFAGSDEINVFRVSPDLWNDITSVEFQTAEGSTNIVNVEGATPELISLGFTNADQNRTLFNMFEATSVTTQSVGVQGSILAPLAHLDHRDAVIDGQVIVASFSGNGQIDFEHFDGFLPVPEPNIGWVWLLVGMFTIGRLADRKRRCG